VLRLSQTMSRRVLRARLRSNLRRDRAKILLRPGAGIDGGIGLRRQPIADPMWLEVGLLSKKRPTERCVMLGTRPRGIAESMTSPWRRRLGPFVTDFQVVTAETAPIA
jgi:hypothetical protein